ncbi:FAD-dependent monooxygenase [Streptomyces sp. AV19]|uniref:FAD-dependent monooxygenase n=1 Tax=Streptomyces sp. AV19 TaxID=2793068 RepID=UPI0018FEC0B0|nr:FAD-dependent monooxygenase [Streptomyces sp. AV19]MBH1938893.1 FAD-dependent monooxygenase [Streptomyces sp. AV19]MDG4533488.1 FAD-dependent monooxygenase [Streptomyces sp. AV19]
MATTHSADVIVVGGGIGGLTAALSLHAAGIEPLVLESAREIRPLGVGINLQPAAVRELDELGLLDELAALGVPAVEHAFADHRGRTLFGEARGTAAGYNWPQYSVHRGELQMMLRDAVVERLGPEALRTGVQAEDFEETEDGVRVHAVDRSTGGPLGFSAEALIAADGIHSTLRGLLHPGQGPLQWNGVTMWRGVTEADSFAPGNSVVIAADDKNTQFVAYQISRAALDRGRTLVNWVCLVPTGEPGALGTDVNWNAPGTIEDLLPHYADWHFDWTDLPELFARSEQILEYPMVDRDPLPFWGRGRVTLLGDAAHPGYPSGANGGTQAIIDARVLAYHLAVEPDVGKALAAYEAERREATSAIVLANREMDRVGRNKSAAAGAPSGESIEKVTEAYRKAAGEAEKLNSRASLTPPAAVRG